MMSQPDVVYDLDIPDEIKGLLKSRLLSYHYDIDEIYTSFRDYFNQQFNKEHLRGTSAPILDVGDLNSAFQMIREKEIRTAGIDFPILLRKGSGRPVLMVCAMDPYRADEGQLPDTKLSYWVPFSIIKNPEKEKKYTEKENLVFFHGLLNQYDLYVTDVFKVFYREGHSTGNSQPEYTSLPIHKEILMNEIKIVKPDAILTLGNNARNAICKILDLNVPKWSDTIYATRSTAGLQVIMVPHISGAANGAKSKILKNDDYRHIDGTGNSKYASIILHEIKA